MASVLRFQLIRRKIHFLVEEKNIFELDFLEGFGLPSVYLSVSLSVSWSKGFSFDSSLWSLLVKTPGL